MRTWGWRVSGGTTSSCLRAGRYGGTAALSLDQPDPEIDAIWAAEARSRLTAYEIGEAEAVSIRVSTIQRGYAALLCAM
ncbi:addiction module protein [Haliea sp. E1-2-M8]|uniref:addiction module protein n=1 Tax=Haliea sp. E1-2-M8 TaxID=3064706 RepID=UPI00351C846C